MFDTDQPREHTKLISLHLITDTHLIVIITGAEVVCSFLLSNALANMVYFPFAKFDTVTEYGAMLSTPTSMELI